MSVEELAREQAHVDRAYARLEVLRERAKALAEGVLDRRQIATHQSRYERDVTVHSGYRRLAELELGSLPLVFGRIDRSDGEHFHIGRVAVPDDDQTPLVVDWRAPVAEPFYRATPKAPLGLVRRRHFRTRGPRLLGMDDERFGEDGHDLEFVGEAALLQAVTRARTGRMTDIVATIQAEQDAVIRAPMTGVLVVQGGPGTGKTAVALHRAAYLLYSHRARLERAGVLLVGPTPTFLRYIEEVLPSLGEAGVRLATPGDLVGWRTATAVDSPGVARLKGDARMARVLARARVRGGPSEALHALLSQPAKLAEAASGLLSAEERAALARPGDWQGWSPADLPLLDELSVLRPRRRPRRRRRADLEREERWELERFIAEVAAVSPMDEVMGRDLLKRVVAARQDLEEPGEGEELTYGHVLVDEAQDLTPMHWRMLARRCPSGSMTIVGDLAQAMGPWTPRSWDEVLAQLPPRLVTRAELTINYRTPEEIMAFADPLRPAWLRAARPVRRSGTEPVVVQTAPADLHERLAAALREVLEQVEGTVGVVASAAMVASCRDLVSPLRGPALAAAERVMVCEVADAKGLEFDAVVVVEPAAIREEAGSRALYVALTRATQRLTVVTTDPDPVPAR